MGYFWGGHVPAHPNISTFYTWVHWALFACCRMWRMNAFAAARGDKTSVAGVDPWVEIGGYMVSAERERIMGVWGLCPQRGPGAEPLVSGSWGKAPLKLNAFWCCHMSEMALTVWFSLTKTKTKIYKNEKLWTR